MNYKDNFLRAQLSLFLVNFGPSLGIIIISVGFNILNMLFNIIDMGYWTSKIMEVIFSNIHQRFFIPCFI